MVALADGDNEQRHQSTSRKLKAISVDEIIYATAIAHDADRLQYAQFRSQAAGHDMAAWLCRRWTGATLEELGNAFWLSGTGSISNLVRRAERRRNASRVLSHHQHETEKALTLNTQHKGASSLGSMHCGRQNSHEVATVPSCGREPNATYFATSRVDFM